jgi:phosphoribosyl 1,2-cyclic phosphodiesterase
MERCCGARARAEPGLLGGPTRRARGTELAMPRVGRAAIDAGVLLEEERMQIEFWGVRGSIASPGPETAWVGGNTSCVEVRCGDVRLVLDAGTGLRALGDALIAESARTERPIDVTLFLSHLHWDHIQGIPFFAPAYVPTTRLAVYGAPNGIMPLRETLGVQMAAPVFPVRLDDLAARIDLRELHAGDALALGGPDAGVTVRAATLNHPGGVHAYRIEHGGRSVVYATDTEHGAGVDPQLLALARGADVLVYDAQYTEEEYVRRVGWGHSTYVHGCELAHAAGIGQLVLFHHDPSRTDAEVAALEARARGKFAASVAARERMVLDLPARPRPDLAPAGGSGTVGPALVAA